MCDKRENPDFATCPYNSAHRMQKHRLSTHIVKCRRNYPDSKMVPCEFNNTHLIPEPELQYHHQTCFDRKPLEAEIMPVMTSNCEEKFPIQQHSSANTSSECWDDINIPTYDPKQYVENNEILRRIDTESQSKRKRFRISERQRLMEINSRKPRAPVPSGETVFKVNLPQHRSITHISDNMSKMIEERIIKGANRVFMPSDK